MRGEQPFGTGPPSTMTSLPMPACRMWWSLSIFPAMACCWRQVLPEFVSMPQYPWLSASPEPRWAASRRCLPPSSALQPPPGWNGMTSPISATIANLPPICCAVRSPAGNPASTS